MTNMITSAGKKIVLSMFFFLLFASAHGQVALSNLITEHNILKSREIRRDMSYESIEGDPYYSKDYVKSIVYLPSGDSVSIDLRYDLFINEMEYKKNGMLMWVTKNQVQAVTHGGENLVVTEVAGEKEPAYLFVVQSGNFSLLRKKSVAFREAAPAKAYADPVPARFEAETDVYFIKNNKFPAQEAMTKKQLDEIVSGKPEAIEFIKKQKIRAGREKDLAELVRFMNNQ